MHQIERTVLVPLPAAFGVDFSITNEVLLVFIAGTATFLVLLLACRRTGLTAHGPLQNFFEGVIEFIDREVLGDCLGRDGRRWATLLMTLFFFILFANLTGIVPAPQFFQAATGNLNVTAPLAVMIFVTTVVVNIQARGIGGFLGRFAPPGVPLWLLPVVVPIEVISWLARPFSLAVRLFANMMAGHALMVTFTTMTVAAGFLLKPLPLAGAVIMQCFEIFICFVQAFIFVMLAALYLKDAVEDPHG